MEWNQSFLNLWVHGIHVINNFKRVSYYWNMICIYKSFWKHSDLITICGLTWVLLVIKQSMRSMGLTQNYGIAWLWWSATTLRVLIKQMMRSMCLTQNYGTAWLWWPAATLRVQYLRFHSLRGGKPMDYLGFSQILILIHKS
jgi:hypothetical protein